MAAAAFAGAMFVSAYSQSVAMGEQAKQEELIAQNNELMAKIKIEQTLKQGDEDVAKLRGQVAKFKGTQKAAMAASGTDIGYGSNIRTQFETDILAIEDEQRLKNNAALQAWGFKVESINNSFQQKYKANALRNQAQSTLLGGAVQAGAFMYSTRGMKVPGGNDFGGGTSFTGGDVPSSSNIA